jgi:hypothetical protein
MQDRNVETAVKTHLHKLFFVSSFILIIARKGFAKKEDGKTRVSIGKRYLMPLICVFTHFFSLIVNSSFCILTLQATQLPVQLIQRASF